MGRGEITIRRTIQLGALLRLPTANALCRCSASTAARAAARLTESGGGPAGVFPSAGLFVVGLPATSEVVEDWAAEGVVPPGGEPAPAAPDPLASDPDPVPAAGSSSCGPLGRLSSVTRGGNGPESEPTGVIVISYSALLSNAARQASARSMYCVSNALSGVKYRAALSTMQSRIAFFVLDGLSAAAGADGSTASSRTRTHATPAVRCPNRPPPLSILNPNGPFRNRYTPPAVAFVE